MAEGAAADESAGRADDALQAASAAIHDVVRIRPKSRARTRAAVDAILIRPRYIRAAARAPDFAFARARWSRYFARPASRSCGIDWLGIAMMLSQMLQTSTSTFGTRRRERSILIVRSSKRDCTTWRQVGQLQATMSPALQSDFMGGSFFLDGSRNETVRDEVLATVRVGQPHVSERLHGRCA